MQATVKYRMVTLISAPGAEPMRKHYDSVTFSTLDEALTTMFRQNCTSPFLWTIEPVVAGMTP